MRSLLLAVLAAIAIPACTDDITGSGPPGGGGSGSNTGAVCGDGIVEAGEQCDDGNTVNGDGCSSTCQIENTSTPSAVINVDMTTIGGTTTPVELGVETDVTVTAMSMMGYTGAVTLTVAAVGADGTTPITDWTMSFDNPSLTLTDGGTATAKLGILAMGDTMATDGTIKITATAGTQTSTVPIAVTLEPQMHVEFTNNGNNCVYPTGAPTYKVKAGRKLAVYNMATGTTAGFVIHSNLGTTSGFAHEAQSAPGTIPGAAYLGSTAGTTPLAIVGGAATTVFYCHVGVTGTLVDAGNSALYPTLTIVP